MFACFGSVLLHGTQDAVAPGRVLLTLELLPVTTPNTLLTIFGGAIISLRMLGSVVRGKPLSIISSRSCRLHQIYLSFSLCPKLWVTWKNQSDEKKQKKGKWGNRMGAHTQIEFTFCMIQKQNEFNIVTLIEYFSNLTYPFFWLRFCVTLITNFNLKGSISFKFHTELLLWVWVLIQGKWILKKNQTTIQSLLPR